MYSFTPTGVCAKQILFDVTDGIIHDVQFINGCPGSLSALSKMLEGQSIENVISTLKGTTCGKKDTSCPDRLVEALEDVINGKGDAYKVKPAANLNPFG